jgi:hypothetical protein
VGKKSLRAQFGRKRTHNEQLFVAPCGMIIARETFFHAEAIYSVIVSLFKFFFVDFSTRDLMESHCTGDDQANLPYTGYKARSHFFDNNCSIAKAVKNDPFFQDIGLTVDVFHFKCKHSEKDVFCQEKCNPAAYPELLGEGLQQWYFNSSVAEQTNSWLGGYHAICREMTVHRYNFFLDEMIRRRNQITLDKLIKGKQEPKTWPILT